jgi:hypothetical protein
VELLVSIGRDGNKGIKQEWKKTKKDKWKKERKIRMESRISRKRQKHRGDERK